MAPDTDNVRSGDGKQDENVATKLDQFTDSVKPEVEPLSEDQVRLVKRGVKVGFTALLIVLLVYWAVAYQTGIELFEF